MAGGEQVPAPLVPQYLGGGAREPEPAQLFAGGDVFAGEGAQRPLERRRCGRVSLCDQQRQPIQQQIWRVRWLRHHRRGPGSLSCLAQTVPCHGTVGVYGKGERLQISLPRQPGVERFEASRGLEQLRWNAAAAAGGERDLPAQQVGPGSLELIKRSGLRRSQQPQGRIERAGLGRCARGGQRALRPLGRLKRQRRGTLEESGRRGQTAARLGAVGGSLELGCDVRIGRGRRLGAVPRASIGIGARIGRLGDGTVGSAPFGD